MVKSTSSQQFNFGYIQGNVQPDKAGNKKKKSGYVEVVLPAVEKENEEECHLLFENFTGRVTLNTLSDCVIKSTPLVDLRSPSPAPRLLVSLSRRGLLPRLLLLFKKSLVMPSSILQFPLVLLAPLFSRSATRNAVNQLGPSTPLSTSLESMMLSSRPSRMSPIGKNSLVRSSTTRAAKY